MAGNEKGAGCTHTALAIAEYKAGFCGKKTAYIDYTKEGQIENIMFLFSDGSIRQEKGFALRDIDFYFGLTERELLSVWKKPYECLVFDFGVLWKDCEARREFEKCQDSFLVCDLCDWKKERFFRNLKSEQNLFATEPRYLARSCSKEDVLWMRKKTDLCMEQIGYIKDPFFPTKKEIEQIKNLFRGR